MNNEFMNVLLVEDSEADAKLILRELRRTARIVDWRRVEDPEALRGALAEREWDIVLSDWAMPRLMGLEALAIVRECAPQMPFIVVSGTVGEEIAVQAMRLGAQDYLLKDRLARLAPAVERELRDHAERAARARAEESLRLSEARFARLAESGIIGICIADILGNIHDANNSYIDMLGYSREEVLSGQARWDDITPPEWKPTDQVAIAQLQSGGVAQPWEKELVRKDGSRIPILLGVAMLDYPMCIAFQLDLTERKRAEEALRRSEERLVQSQKMEAIGSLAGGIAHDFNNLLSVILSYAGMVAEDLKSSDPMRGDLKEIEVAARRAADLTRQLLAFSRQQVLQPQLVNLNTIVANMEKMLRRLIGEDIELTTAEPSDLALVLVDPGQVEQVIMNLAVNARDAMPTGGKLLIETANVVLDETFAADHAGVVAGEHVMLAVTDTGTGMDKVTLTRIFEPFFTTKETGKGTGLGLSTVFGIVRQSLGSVWVYSELGKGTSFKIYFPRATVEFEEKMARPEPISLEQLRGSETILLVEDEPQVRNLTRTILRRYGYRVIEAQNGGEALLTCEQYPATIDLLVTDVVMPRMSGRELAERLKTIRPLMKTLYMSGYTDTSIIRHGVLEPGFAFLQKPITPEVLIRKVREVLDRPKLRTS